jgi:hypothetical protein
MNFGIRMTVISQLFGVSENAVPATRCAKLFRVDVCNA